MFGYDTRADVYLLFIRSTFSLFTELMFSLVTIHESIFIWFAWLILKFIPSCSKLLTLVITIQEFDFIYLYMSGTLL